MRYIDEIFLWLGAVFTMETYMFHTKVQGILWSVADVILILVLLRIADHTRAGTKRERIIWRYVLLCLTAVITPLLLLSKTPREFFLLESVICGTQFVILVYSIIVERRGALDFFKGMMNEKGANAPDSP